MQEPSLAWKTDYLAGFFELIAADGVEHRELLALEGTDDLLGIEPSEHT
jgi:hypothetical protein